MNYPQSVGGRDASGNPVTWLTKTPLPGGTMEDYVRSLMPGAYGYAFGNESIPGGNATEIFRRIVTNTFGEDYQNMLMKDYMGEHGFTGRLNKDTALLKNLLGPAIQAEYLAKGYDDYKNQARNAMTMAMMGMLGYHTPQVMDKWTGGPFGMSSSGTGSIAQAPSGFSLDAERQNFQGQNMYSWMQQQGQQPPQPGTNRSGVSTAPGGTTKSSSGKAGTKENDSGAKSQWSGN